jgi:hypothetical protein
MAFLISEDKGGKWGISTVVQANDVHVLVWRQVLLGKKIVMLHFASSVSSSNIFKCDGLLNRKSCKVPKQA